MKFKNINQFIEVFGLRTYIDDRKKRWKKNTFGKDVEAYIVAASKLVDNFKVTKTTPEYDYLFGADFKVFVGQSSTYCDLKISMTKDRLKDVDIFLGHDFKLSAGYEDMLIIDLDNGLHMCLGVRYKRTMDQGIIIYEKPVLVPIVFGNIRKEEIISERFIRDFKMLVSIGSNELELQGYSSRTKSAFTLMQKTYSL